MSVNPPIHAGGMFCEVPDPAFTLVMEAPVVTVFDDRVVEPVPDGGITATPPAPVPPWTDE